MDVRKFMKLVSKNTCLWDTGDEFYHSRDHHRNAWQKISEEMDIPVNEIKKRWRGLRDNFGRELKKAIDKNSDLEAATEFNSKWPHFKHLLFLRYTVTSRRGAKSKTTETFEINDEEDSADQLNTNVNSPTPPSPDQSSDDEPPKKILKSPIRQKISERQSDAIDARLLQIEEEKLQHFKQSANDPDSQFLMSLLPFLKDTPKHRKLIVRAKLQQVFLDEEQMTSTEDTKLFYDSS